MSARAEVDPWTQDRIKELRRHGRLADEVSYSHEPSGAPPEARTQVRFPLGEDLGAEAADAYRLAIEKAARDNPIVGPGLVRVYVRHTPEVDSRDRTAAEMEVDTAEATLLFLGAMEGEFIESAQAAEGAERAGIPTSRVAKRLMQARKRLGYVSRKFPGYQSRWYMCPEPSGPPLSETGADWEDD